MSRRVYLFGIGSPAWQKATGHTVSKLGVPIPSHGPSTRKLRAITVPTFGFSTGKRRRRRRR